MQPQSDLASIHTQFSPHSAAATEYMSDNGGCQFRNDLFETRAS